LKENEEYDSQDSLSTVITNRKTLADFLQLVNQLSDIDMVVCDMSFDIATEYDSLLQKQLDTLSSRNKLLLSKNINAAALPVFQLDEAVYGNISEKANHGLFVSHRIKNADHFSLPYKLYHKFNNITTGKQFFFNLLLREKRHAGTSFITNTFFPRLTMTDENKLTGYKEIFYDRAGNHPDTGYETDTKGFYFLGSTVGDGGEDFKINLQQRKAHDYRNIIFIGSFTSPIEDLHQTLKGPLHGPTILLNIFYALQKGQHKLNASFILLLFFAFFIITYILFCNSLEKKIFPDKDSSKTPGIKKHRKPVSSKTRNSGPLRFTAIIFFKFLREESHFILLIPFVLLLNKFTSHIVNILPLVIYFGILNLCLKFGFTEIILSTKKHP
jgi:hypothetical protein